MAAKRSQRASSILKRTIITSIIYTIICVGFAYLVLTYALSFPNEDCKPVMYANIWTCYLIAILSMTGIGWSGLGSWVDAMSISPDYTETCHMLENLIITLENIRKKERSNRQDIADFYKGATDLRSSLEKNIYLEPEWAKQDQERMHEKLNNLIFLTEEKFLNKNKEAVNEFASACNYQDPELLYGGFIATLKELCSIWKDANINYKGGSVDGDTI